MKAKCVCCRALNALNEAIKHPSVTSLRAAKAASEALSGQPGDIILSIADCQIHGSLPAFERFWAEYDQKCEQVNGDVRDQVARQILHGALRRT